jgi:hypothetical protein
LKTSNLPLGFFLRTPFYVNANVKQKHMAHLNMTGFEIINDAFTLDMILILDFGQTKFDDQIFEFGSV